MLIQKVEIVLEKNSNTTLNVTKFLKDYKEKICKYFCDVDSFCLIPRREDNYLWDLAWRKP